MLYEFCETLLALPSSKYGGSPKTSDHKLTINWLGQHQLDNLKLHFDSIMCLCLYSFPDAKQDCNSLGLISGLMTSVIVFTIYFSQKKWKTYSRTQFLLFLISIRSVNMVSSLILKLLQGHGKEMGKNNVKRSPSIQKKGYLGLQSQMVRFKATARTQCLLNHPYYSTILNNIIKICRNIHIT